MDASRYADLFFAEAGEILGRCHGSLVELERGSAPECLEEVFRGVHTLKGMAAAMGYVAAADVAHAMEHLLVGLRAGTVSADPEVVDSLLEGLDGFEQACARARAGAAAPEDATSPRGVAAPTPSLPSPLVRVRADRLEALGGRVVDLLVARDRLAARAARGTDGELMELAGELASAVGGIRDAVAGLGRVPAAEVLDRFPRLVRDAARRSGKHVELRMEGRGEEIDRSIAAELGELLVHLLRNAVDHGIEAPEERRQAGKPEAGVVRLGVSQDRAGVHVRVEDDGRGLQRGRILREALQRGWTTTADSDGSLLSLITRAGFTTAERLTDVSGRGVGLDVVRSHVEGLGGSLAVESEEGRGTTFTLRLPQSFAVQRTLELEAAGERYEIPLGAVVEVAEAPDAASAGGGVTWRGATLPALRLGSLLHPSGAEPAPETAMLVVEASRGRFALLVERLLGQREAVVKPFDVPAAALPVFAGATLRSDGRPSLVLDPERLACQIGTASVDS